MRLTASSTRGDAARPVRAAAAAAIDLAAAVGCADDVRVEHAEQRFEIALAPGGANALDDPRLLLVASAGKRGRAVRDVAAGAGGELADRRRRAADDLRDLVEGEPEHVVQHERGPLGG